ncbi:hypothetical protein PENSPDRAFT_738509 [Peniophora sp. CONT]|nr:hypothetical protein PENSPDRAFT_738509 [Peniophora sp. CONT]
MSHLHLTRVHSRPVSIACLPSELLQECLIYLPFVFDEFVEVHRCHEEYKDNYDTREGFHGLLETYSPFGEDQFSPGNRPGIEVANPLAPVQWRRTTLSYHCRRKLCRVRYWNWLETRRVCVAWKRAADGCPAFNSRIALQSEESAQRSIERSATLPLYLYVTERSWLDHRDLHRAKELVGDPFPHLVCQLLQYNLHRIAEIVITVYSYHFHGIWSYIELRRPFARPAPLLRRFQIQVHVADIIGNLRDVAVDPAQTVAIDPAHIFASNSIPRLRHVLVRGMSLPSTSPLFPTSLVSLVVHGSGTQWTTTTAMFATLSTMSQLEVLSLCFSHHYSPRIDRLAEEILPLVMPRLNTLNVEARRPLLSLFMDVAFFSSTTVTHIACLVGVDDEHPELIESTVNKCYEKRPRAWKADDSKAYYQNLTLHRDYDERTTKLVFSRPYYQHGHVRHALPAVVSATAIQSPTMYDNGSGCIRFLRAVRNVVPCRLTRLSIIVKQTLEPFRIHSEDDQLWKTCLGSKPPYYCTEIRLDSATGRDLLQQFGGRHGDPLEWYLLRFGSSPTWVKSGNHLARTCGTR